MFLTRTFGAVLLASLVSGGAYAAEGARTAQQILTISATIPAQQPKLDFDNGLTAIMDYNEATTKLDKLELPFTVKGNSSVSMYLDANTALTHKSDTANTIPLLVSAKLGAGNAERLKVKNEAQGKGFVVIKPSESSFNAKVPVVGTLVIDSTAQGADLRAGKYEGSITVIVEANEEDANT